MDKNIERKQSKKNRPQEGVSNAENLSISDSKQASSMSPPPLQFKTEIAEEKASVIDKNTFAGRALASPTLSPINTNNSQEAKSPFKLEESAAIQKKGTNTSYQLKKSNSSSSDLPDDVRGKMETAFQTDFSNVNIHTNSRSATDVGALAYTQGDSVHFAPGQFKPETQHGQELIGHELAHVVQQRQGRVQATTNVNGMPVNDNISLEAEADKMGKTALQMKPQNEQKHSNQQVSSNNGVIQRMPIFINGRAGDADKASLSYWQSGEGNGLIDTVGEHYSQYELGEEPALEEGQDFAQSKWMGDYLLLNGDRGFQAGTRATAGQSEAIEQFPEILKRLYESRNEAGEITERIQVFTHSRGSVFGNSFIQTLRTMFGVVANNPRIKFAYGLENIFEIVVNMAPHQASSMSVPSSNTPTVSISHSWDPLSEPDVKGDSINILTSGFGRTGGSHRNSTFIDELDAVLDQHQTNEQTPVDDRYNGFDGLLDNQESYSDTPNFDSNISLTSQLQSRIFPVTNGSVKITANSSYASQIDSGKYKITLYQSDMGFDTKYKSVKFSTGISQYYTWDNLETGEYYFIIETINNEDISLNGNVSIRI